MLNRQYYVNETEETAFHFQSIYELASQLNEMSPDDNNYSVLKSKLTNLYASKNVDYLYHGYSPAGLLAKEGKNHAVDLLIDLFNLSAISDYENYTPERVNKNLKDALECYAIAGNVTQVNRLLAHPASLGRYVSAYTLAALGFARGGHHHEIEEIISRVGPHNINDVSIEAFIKEIILSGAAKGYAFEGDLAKVEEMIARGASLDIAIEGYARAGNASQILNLLNRGAQVYFILSGFKNAGYFEKCITKKDTTLLDIFALFDYPVCEALILSFKEDPSLSVGPPPGVEDKSCLRKFVELSSSALNLMKEYRINFKDAYKINLLMQEHHMNFKMAYKANKFMDQYHLTPAQINAWSLPEVQTWMLEGTQKFNEEDQDQQFIPKGSNLPPEIYFYILSFLCELSDTETLILFNKMYNSHDSFFINKSILMKDLEQVVLDEKKSNNGISHFGLFSDCKKATTKEELIQVLNSENKTSEFYHQHIEERLNRLMR